MSELHSTSSISRRRGSAARRSPRNDEFFAEKENLLDADARRVRREHEYTDRGKWMDGWETRRRRPPTRRPGRDGHDWCIVRLGVPGVIRGVVVDTAFFRGNYPESCAIDALRCDEPLDAARARARRVDEIAAAQRRSNGDAQNVVRDRRRDQRLHAPAPEHLPDGGVARLRVHGEVVPDWDAAARGAATSISRRSSTARWSSTCSDMFFGPRHNLIMPRPARSMGDGWETRRRRGPGHDWAIVRLGARRHDRARRGRHAALQGQRAGRVQPRRCTAAAPEDWQDLLPRTPLQADCHHAFDKTLRSIPRATYVRLNIFPDGGVARLRLFGRPE